MTNFTRYAWGQTGKKQLLADPVFQRLEAWYTAITSITEKRYCGSFGNPARDAEIELSRLATLMGTRSMSKLTYDMLEDGSHPVYKMAENALEVLNPRKIA